VSATATAYPLAYRHLGRGRVDLLTADIRVGLTNAQYVPAAGDEWWGPVSAGFEIAGAGYVAGGQPIAHRSFDYDPVVGAAVLVCDPVVFPDAFFTCRRAVVYAAAATPGSSPLLSWVDFGALIAPAGQSLTVTFTAGVLSVGPAA
jgi:hypothetical protein